MCLKWFLRTGYATTRMVTKRNLTPAVLRKRVIDMAFAGNSVHIGCAFSIIEILTTIYSRFVRFPGNRVDDPARDFVILSKGHGVMAQYACLEQIGFLEAGAIDRYFADGTPLHGLCEAVVPGCEVSTGS